MANPSYKQSAYTQAALAALTASGTSQVVDFFDAIPTDHSYVVAVTGSPTAVSIQPQGSVDGVNFVNVGSAQTAAGLFTIASTPLKALRFTVTITGGTSPSVAISTLSV